MPEPQYIGPTDDGMGHQIMTDQGPVTTTLGGLPPELQLQAYQHLAGQMQDASAVQNPVADLQQAAQQIPGDQTTPTPVQNPDAPADRNGEPVDMPMQPYGAAMQGQGPAVNDPTPGVLHNAGLPWGPGLTAPPAQPQPTAQAQPQAPQMAPLVQPTPVTIPGGGTRAAGPDDWTKRQNAANFDERNATEAKTAADVEKSRDVNKSIQGLGDQATANYAADLQRQQAASLSAKNMLQQSSQLLDQRLNEKIDPNRVWHNKSTGQKVSSILGQILGGFTQGFSEGKLGNAALDRLKDEQEKDIQAQRDEMAQKKDITHDKLSLYQRAIAQGMDENRARSLSDADFYHTVQQQVEAKMKTASTPQEAANGKVLLAQLAQKQNEATQQHVMQTAQVEAEHANTGLAYANTQGKRIENQIQGQNLQEIGLAKAAQQNLANGHPLGALPEEQRTAFLKTGGADRLAAQAGAAQKPVDRTLMPYMNPETKKLLTSDGFMMNSPEAVGKVNDARASSAEATTALNNAVATLQDPASNFAAKQAALGIAKAAVAKHLGMARAGGADVNMETGLSEIANPYSRAMALVPGQEGRVLARLNEGRTAIDRTTDATLKAQGHPGLAASRGNIQFTPVAP